MAARDGHRDAARNRRGPRQKLAHLAGDHQLLGCFSHDDREAAALRLDLRRSAIGQVGRPVEVVVQHQAHKAQPVA